jgi:hypothetical protein
MTGDTGAGGVNHSSTGATGGFFQMVAPQLAGFPRVHFQEILDTALYSFVNLQADHCYYQITAFAVDGNESGPYTAGRLAERARTLLTNPSMSVSGKSLLYSRFDRSVPAKAEWDEGGSRYIYSKGFYLELWLA